MAPTTKYACLFHFVVLFIVLIGGLVWDQDKNLSNATEVFVSFHTRQLFRYLFHHTSVEDDTTDYRPTKNVGERGKIATESSRRTTDENEGIVQPETNPIQVAGKMTKIVIIGCGPTGLGAARRLFDVAHKNKQIEIIVLEQYSKPGGLASSTRNRQGFLWDVGVHVIFSHYSYFDRVLNMAVPEWNYRRRASFAFMKGSDGIRRFVPYPVQNNIHTMGKADQEKCLEGLRQISKNRPDRAPQNFDEWLLQKFGSGLSDLFMRKYNRKIWTVDTNNMNSDWVGERVAVPDVREIEAKIRETERAGLATDSAWGPNRYFRYPKYNGTGGIWEAVATQLPREWFRFNSKVIGVDVDKKVMTIEVNNTFKHRYALRFDIIISTAPLDVFASVLQSKDEKLPYIQGLASRLLHTHTHIVGLGLRGKLPERLADKSWVYFPDSDSPFYRLTMFSNYSDDHVAQPGSQWSLMCEIAEPKKGSNPSYWNRDNLVEESIKALVLYGFITADMVLCTHYQRLEHGYPVPTLERDMILDVVQPWLQTKDIYSRGRFGGWRYEVANQDHSFMQGVEVVDKIVNNVTELTYPTPNIANSKKNTDRIIPLDYEIVVACNNQNLEWIAPFASHTLVYHTGHELGPPRQFYSWERLANAAGAAHVYLNHVMTNYYQLANITIFADSTGKTDMCVKTHIEHIPMVLEGPRCIQRDHLHVQWERRVFPKEVHGGQCKLDQQHQAGITIGQIYKDLFGHRPPKEGLSCCRDVCFAATNTTIRGRPFEFYKKALDYITRYHLEQGNNFFNCTEMFSD